MAAVPITTRRAVWLSVLWLAAGLAMGLVVLGLLGTDRAVNYWSVYVLERSLSLDNVFVFLLVLDYFVIPSEYRRRVVRWGIVCALALRALTIAFGAVLLETFTVVTYVLGAVLLLLAARMLRSRDEPIDPGGGGAFRILRRVVPLTGDSSTGRLVARTQGGWVVTPVGLAVVALVLPSAIGDVVAPPHVAERAERRPPRCPPGHAAPLEPVAARSGEPGPL